MELSAVPPIRCPLCGSELVPLMGWEGGGYTALRVFNGLECSSCGAEWDERGQPTAVYEATLERALNREHPW